MKEKVLLILYKRRMSYRNLLFWAELHHSDSFATDYLQMGKSIANIIDELFAAGFIEWTEYIDDMYGKENIRWNGYKVTALGEAHLIEQNLV